MDHACVLFAPGQSASLIIHAAAKKNLAQRTAMLLCVGHHKFNLASPSKACPFAICLPFFSSERGRKGSGRSHLGNDVPWVEGQTLYSMGQATREKEEVSFVIDGHFWIL